ncbi:T9SS type A sorting domain-containing protein [Marinoscillum furvescens]|uniref:Putative secreted protein (Por secretion system target) n=1 Tax=Marinoscillum furvescens DSM 4134 TaxID=1122208 RepID=A0A3D9KZ21_MARFU|nr:T9SS type A sorting domain-containing protein [Marinoscillum furvescens]RED94105.1 putative secreted protein (Por secretion system target) [Marinoscillum furvescens DSM 4134]
MNKLIISLWTFTFILGELSAQTITIKHPPEAHTFAVGKRPNVIFTSPADAPSGSQFDYELKVCQIEEGQTKQEAISENDPFFFKSIDAVNVPNQQPVELPYFSTDQLQSQFAVQVTADIIKDGDTTFAYSNIQTFYSPLRVPFFYVGNVMVKMDTGSTDIDNYWGIGNIKYLFEDARRDSLRIEVDGLKLTHSYGYHYMDGGRITIDTAIEYSFTPRINQNLADFQFTTDSFLLYSNSSWIYNKGVTINAAKDFENISDINLSFKGRTKHLRFEGPFGSMTLEDTLTVPISDANMFLEFLPTTKINLYNLEYTLNYDLAFHHPMLKTTKDTSSMIFRWNAESKGQTHNYLDLDDFMSDTLVFSQAMNAHLILGHHGHRGAVIDLSDTISPYAMPKDWKGIYFRDAMLTYPEHETQHKVNNILVHPNGIDAVISHVLEDSLVMPSIPFNHSFHRVHYSLKNSTLDHVSRLIGNIDSELIADSTRVMFISLENDQMTYPFVIRSEGDTVHFTPPYGLPTTRITDKTAMINWIDMGAEFTYEVDISTDTFKTFVPDYQAKKLTDHTALLVGLDPDTDYQYRIRAYQDDELVSQSTSDILLAFRTKPLVLGQIERAHIYPNPARDRLFMTLESPLSQISLKLIDLSGKVYFNDMVKSSGSKKFSLDIADYPKGIYLLSIGEGSPTKVFIE